MAKIPISNVSSRLLAITALLYINTAFLNYSTASGASLIMYFSVQAHKHGPGDLLLFFAMFRIGSIVGGLISGFVVDWRGRRVGLAIGSLLIIAGTIIQGSTSLESSSQLLAGRLISGFGFAITSSAATILVGELSPPKARGSIMGLGTSAAYVGALLGLLTTYGMAPYSAELKWRLPILFQLLPSCIVLFTLKLIPESPRFLVSRGQIDAAIEILANYHARGNKDSDIVRFQMKEMREESERDQAYTSTTFVGSMRAVGAIFSSKATLYRLFLCWVISWAPGITYLDYYVSDIIIESELSTGLLLGYGIGLSVIALVCSLGGSLFLIDTIGRRRTGLYSTIFIALSYAAVGGATAVAKTSSAAAIATLVLVYVGYAAYSALWSPLEDVYALEIWPFALRAKAMSANYILSGLSGYFYSYISSYGFGNLDGTFLFVIGGLCAVWAALIWFFVVETNGHTLEAIDKIFNSNHPIKESLKPPKFGDEAIPDFVVEGDLKGSVGDEKA
ncbi:general substrate transporter [Cladochytrium replicatum]|nr:general substrate transporter [Cladochytrium replicatum]